MVTPPFSAVRSGARGVDGVSNRDVIIIADLLRSAIDKIAKKFQEAIGQSRRDIGLKYQERSDAAWRRRNGRRSR
nr:MAG TPA: hypothetical protein [Caudoviricetes sp.]